MIHLLPLVPRQIDLTGNFLLSQSPWVRILRLFNFYLHFPSYAGSRLSDISISASQFLYSATVLPFTASRMGTSQIWVNSGFYLTPMLIVQQLKPLVRKDFVSKACRICKLFGHRTLKFAWGRLYPNAETLGVTTS